VLQSSSVPPSVPALRRFRWKAALWITLLAVPVLVAAQRLVPALRARLFLPTAEAQWIWKAQGRLSQGPVAFYAARDFDLAEVPPNARLLAAADEEYALTLNGKPVGSGGLTESAGPTDRLDVYEVGPLLRPGGNRLVAELRSGRGAGGFLARIEDPATGKSLVVTDGHWRLFDRYQIGVLRGWLPLDKDHGAIPAFRWGYPPTGRWGWPKPGPVRPVAEALTGGASPVAAARGALPGFTLHGPRAVFDWGREVEGYLQLDLPPGESLGTGLLFTGLQPPDPIREPPAGAVLVAPGSPIWTDARPRRFRYAVILGIERPLVARVLPLTADAAARAALLPGGPSKKGERGILGIVPPPLRTPVEDEVWGKFKRVPRVAGREEL
jgi:hypothetical protein